MLLKICIEYLSLVKQCQHENVMAGSILNTFGVHKFNIYICNKHGLSSISRKKSRFAFPFQYFQFITHSFENGDLWLLSESCEYLGSIHVLSLLKKDW